MRKVQVYKYEKKPGKTYMDKVSDGEGYFHQWGMDYEELHDGVGNYTTAIIERLGGDVENVPVGLIKFIP